MKQTSTRILYVLFLGFFLTGTLVGPSSRVSASAPDPRPDAQTEVDLEQVYTQLGGWFSSAFAGQCFNSRIRLGDTSKIRARFNAGDVQVYVDPEFLDEEGAAAAYVDYSALGLGYFNDLVLMDVPAKVPPQTLWHETMHAIFDDHDSELSAIGASTDERYTWYMELVVNALRNTLTLYDSELKKGEACDPKKLESRWNLFAKQMNDARNTNGFGYITDEQIRQLENLTGFHVNVDEIRQYYDSEACGVCGSDKPVSTGTSDALDLIFCIDVTGSMEDDIASVKAAASNVVNTIAAKNENYRVAIVAYRDWDDSAGYAMFEDYAFSSNKDTIISNINSLSVGGGDDEPEAVFEALMRAIDSKSVGGWRNNVNKQIILMGDAPPHNPSREGYTPAIVAKAAWDADPVVIQSLVVANDGFYNTEAAEAFRDLAERTDGNFFEADNADEVPEVLQKSIEVIEMPDAASWLEDNALLLAAGAGLFVFFIFVLLILAMLLRRGRRRTAPRPVAQAAVAAPYPASPAPAARPERAGYGAPSPIMAGPARGNERTVAATALSAMELVVVAGVDAGKRFPLKPSNRLGRADDNEIVLHDNRVSRYHAVITHTGAGYIVTDLGSANGTWINGLRIAQPAQLRPGDEIMLGANQLIVQERS